MFIPATSIEGLRREMVDMGITKSNQAMLLEKLLDSNPLFPTGNTDTVSCSNIFSIEDGPVVV